MKVLVISSSPREGGNSDVLCDQFLKGAHEAGHEAEKVWLAAMDLAPCEGCYKCAKSKNCVHEDGMDALLQKLIDADVIVLSTPVYFYSMSAQMKIFIDRCLPRCREQMRKMSSSAPGLGSITTCTSTRRWSGPTSSAKTYEENPLCGNNRISSLTIYL